MSETPNVHGSAILVGSMGILVRGPARSGKSALCLSTLRRAASLGLDSRLVADDRVLIGTGTAGLVLSAPASLRGLIEISGVGIVNERTIDVAPLSLVVDLSDPSAIERMPEETEEAVTISDATIRRIRLPARSAAFGADVLVSLALGAGPPGG
ncbi:MAG TPA: HPr kinase/phosphatase C-terminal domain-containing protein [Aurantimonas sp.]|jgi:HPr kinase/phosphorylase|nr:HPr kinase/phosphatase C-terminal domain-containing protein [Aurantimonas sp.]